MALTVSQIRCLIALLSLRGMSAEIASKNVAKILGVSRPSVHRMLDRLGEMGLTEKERYGTVRLTEKGVECAKALEDRKEKLLLLFSRTHQLPLDESGIAAVVLMVELSEESLCKLEDASVRAQGS